MHMPPHVYIIVSCLLSSHATDIPPPIHRWVHDFNDDKPLGHRRIEVLRDLPLAALQSAIATAEAEGMVDATVIQEAKILLATQPLRAAMERRDVAGLRVAIAVADGEAEADRAIIEVSGGLIGVRRYILYTPPATHHRPPTTHHPPNHLTNYTLSPSPYSGGQGAAVELTHQVAAGGYGRGQRGWSTRWSHRIRGVWIRIEVTPS